MKTTVMIKKTQKKMKTIRMVKNKKKTQMNKKNMNGYLVMLQ